MQAFMIEELVLNDRVREDMEDYRFYRIEYGGVNEDSKMTGSIWLPPDVDEDDVLDVINRGQE